MNIIEKREFIHSHLHQIDESMVDEMFNKINKVIEENYIVGYEADGTPVTKDMLIEELREAENEIERGEYVTIEEFAKESEQWT